MGTALVLAFQVCLLTAPADCREVPPIPLAEGTGLIGCMLAAQPEGAKWVAAHPNYFIARARCIQPERLFAAT